MNEMKNNRKKKKLLNQLNG